MSEKTVLEDEAVARIEFATEKLHRELLGTVASMRVPLTVGVEMFAALWNILDPKERREIADLVEQAKADTVS